MPNLLNWKCQHQFQHQFQHKEIAQDWCHVPVGIFNIYNMYLDTLNVPFVWSNVCKVLLAPCTEQQKTNNNNNPKHAMLCYDIMYNMTV